MYSYTWPCRGWLFPKKVVKHFGDALAYPSDTAKSNADAFGPLIIANQVLPPHFEALWQHTYPRICADGGANRVYDRIKESHLNPADYVPTHCIGDLDSVRQDTKDFYLRHRTKFIYIPCQDKTDIDKALDFLNSDDEGSGEPRSTKNSKDIVLTGVFGGNISQELGNLHSCWGIVNKQITLIGCNNLCLILQRGLHKIHTPVGMKCGIIPLGSPVDFVKSSGLKWNLNNQQLSFENFISTSNETVNSIVSIEVSSACIWSFDYGDITSSNVKQ
ncbi:thiamin pyrophosphokinase 1-like [Schistocerca gregaria]|uniref:thiamin pyrophosphokinase 1-like n=1 Tax=Schistocerca gregaria TaxID=7010 RepID=UPI00211E9B09|nr:thiamin pyrophosphokinase 1-like [Schistocerca gregaria]